MHMDEKQYTELAVKLEGVDARARSNEHRIDTLEDNIKDLVGIPKITYIQEYHKVHILLMLRLDIQK